MKKFDRDTALASWFFYQTYGVDKKVNTQQKLHYLRLLLACAKADGDISPVGDGLFYRCSTCSWLH